MDCYCMCEVWLVDTYLVLLKIMGNYSYMQ